MITISDNDAGYRLDRFVRHIAAQGGQNLGFASTQRLIRGGEVRVNGGRCRANTIVNAGDVVRLPPSLQEASTAPKQEGKSTAADAERCRALEIARTRSYIVLNKPAGLAVQGGSGIAESIDALLPLWPDTDGELRLVHRLDRATSGVMVIGRGRTGAAMLSAAFAAGEIDKTYLALVEGHLATAEDMIDLPLSVQRVSQYLRRAVVDPKQGKAARSKYRVRAQGMRKDAPFSLVEVSPLNGRLHQIRAHLSAIGHPLVGDAIYVGGGDGGVASRRSEHRLALHAWRIVLPDGKGYTADPDAAWHSMLTRHGIDMTEIEWTPHP